MDTEYSDRFIVTPLLDIPDGQLVEIQPYYGNIKTIGTPLNKLYFDTIRSDLINLGNAIQLKNSRLSIRADFNHPTGNYGQKLDVSNYNFTNINIVEDGDTWYRLTADIPQGINKILIKWYIGIPIDERQYYSDVKALTFQTYIDNSLVVDDYPLNYREWGDESGESTGGFSCIDRYEGEKILNVMDGKKITIENSTGYRNYLNDTFQFNRKLPFFSVDIEVLE